MPTIDAAATRNATDRRGDGAADTSPAVLVDERDIREAVREQRAANLVVLVVDASGSMGADGRIAAAKGAVVALLVDAYERRDRVALVTFREEGAQVVLRPTGSVEVARARLEELRTGGRTPLAAGIETALELALVATRSAHKPLIVLVSDGRATSGPEGADPFRAALEAAGKVRRMRVPAVVVDAENGHVRLGLAGEVALEMGARLVTAGELTADRLASTVRGLLPGS
jgi:magnesium chelatase subunit D